MHLFVPLVLCSLLAQQTWAFPSWQRTSSDSGLYLRAAEEFRDGVYKIPSKTQKGNSKAQFDIQTSASTLGTETLFTLDAPQLDLINGSVFDWWYFDAVSGANADDSLVITFFSSSATAFPFLDRNQSSVLTAWLWASFANGTVFTDYVPATLATVTGADGTHTQSSGDWSSTGFSWAALADDQTKYEIVVASDQMQVQGRFTLTSRVPPHLPCGIQAERTLLEIAPHLGWVNIIPDAVGEVDMEIRGSKLKFQGPGYHDKNWSDRPFMDSVQSWYWGHGHLGAYSIVWFSYLALNDPTNTTYVSIYVAKGGDILVSACKSDILTVRPIGSPKATGGRYPPRLGDIPEGFHLEFDLGEEIGHLRVNVSTRTVVAGDGEYYMRWTGDMVGEVVRHDNEQPKDNCAASPRGGTSNGDGISSLTGVAVFEQFVLVE